MKGHGQNLTSIKVLVQTKDNLATFDSAGTQKVVKTPTNPSEVAAHVEVKIIIAGQQIQGITSGINKGRRSDHYP